MPSPVTSSTCAAPSNSRNEDVSSPPRNGLADTPSSLESAQEETSSCCLMSLCNAITSFVSSLFSCIYSCICCSSREEGDPKADLKELGITYLSSLIQPDNLKRIVEPQCRAVVLVAIDGKVIGSHLEKINISALDNFRNAAMGALERALNQAEVTGNSVLSISTLYMEEREGRKLYLHERSESKSAPKDNFLGPLTIEDATQVLKRQGTDPKAPFISFLLTGGPSQ